MNDRITCYERTNNLVNEISDFEEFVVSQIYDVNAHTLITTYIYTRIEKRRDEVALNRLIFERR